MGMHTPARSRAKLAAIVAVGMTAVVIAGVLTARADSSGSPDAADNHRPKPATLPGWKLLDAPAGIRPLSLGAPLWSSQHGPMEVISGASFQGDRVVVLGGDDKSPASTLAVLDPATGRPAWSLHQLDPLLGGDGAVWWDSTASPRTPQVVRVGGSPAVLVDYIWSECPGWCPSSTVSTTDEFGLAALSPADGHVLWKTPVVPRRPMTNPPPAVPWISAVMSSDTLAVATVESDTDPAARVVALDAATGKLRWQTTGVQPAAVTKDAVLAVKRTATARPAAPGTTTTPGLPTGAASLTLVALDPATGKPRWDLGRRYTDVRLDFVAGDVAVVTGDPAGATGSHKRAPAFPKTETAVIDLADGHRLASLGDRTPRCQTDGTTLIACAVRGEGGRDRLATFDIATRQAHLSRHLILDGQVDDVWGDRVFVTVFKNERPDFPSDYPDPSSRHYEEERARYDAAVRAAEDWRPVELRRSVDPSGRVVDGQAPGSVLAASDRYVIVTCGAIARPCPGQRDPDRIDPARPGRLNDLYKVYRIGPEGQPPAQ